MGTIERLANTTLAPPKDPPAKLVNEMQALIAWVAYNDVAKHDSMKEDQQQEMLYRLYHGNV